MFMTDIDPTTRDLRETDRDDVLLTARQLRKRWGGISEMTPYRRLKDGACPRPLRMGGLRMWRLSDLVQYEALVAVRSGVSNANLAKAPGWCPALKLL
jgi:predicted DNA-binding transcriptional regulator AlpA